MVQQTPYSINFKTSLFMGWQNQFQNKEISHFAITLHCGQKLASTAIHLI